MAKGNILIVLTSHDQLGDSGKPTGFHYEEMTTPYYIFKEAGYEVKLASIQGGEPPYDPGSLKEELEENPESVQRFLQDKDAKAALKKTPQVGELEAKDYDAIYLPGGHGTMWDFPKSSALGQLVSEFYQTDKPVAAVCHGSAGFIGAQDAMSQPIVKGKCINCFTNDEETEVGKDDVVPFLLETALRKLGGEFECSENFEAHVAQDENLITGQNPPSAKPLAEAVLKRLAKAHKKAA